MTDTLTPDRFRALADAYGGVVARWPEAERAAATRMAREPFAVAILADALALDMTLDGWNVPAPSRVLADHIAAQRPRLGTPLGTRTAARIRLWWSGIGLAAALAGAVAGGVAVAVVAPVDGGAGTVTSFGDVVRES